MLRKGLMLLVCMGISGVLYSCGSDEEVADAMLPPGETFYLTGPDDATALAGLPAGDKLLQAVCVDPTPYYDLGLWIDDYNSEIKDLLDLIQLLLKTKGSLSENTWTWSIGPLLRTLTFTATTDGQGAWTYAAKFKGPAVSEYTFLSGTAQSDMSAGSWAIHRPNGDTVVTSNWTWNGTKISVTREVTGTQLNCSYVRDDDQVTVTFQGPLREGTAEWNWATKSGSLTVNNVSACWEYTGGEFCGVDCP